MIKRHPIFTEDLDQVISQPLPWESLSGVVVVLTGASGLLVGGCCEVLLRLNEIELLKKPVKVIAISRNSQTLERRFANYLGRSDLVICPGDVCSKSTLWRGSIDYVIHGASPASPGAMAKNLLTTFEANVIGTKNMLELAINRKAKKFIFLSSGAVYGNVPLGTTKISESVFGELDPRSLRAAYEEGKRAGETLCYLYSNKFGISAPAARIAHTYGPGIKPDDDRSFAEFLSAAIENRPLVLNSEGSDIRYFCYLSDTLSALFTILLLSKDNLAYNIGSSTEFLSILDLANLIVSLFPERGLTIERSNKNRNSEQVTTTSRQRVVPLDTNRLKNLGWTEKVKLVDGLRRTILAGSLYGAT